MKISAMADKAEVLRALKLLRRPFKTQTWVWVEIQEGALVLHTGDETYQAHYLIRCQTLEQGCVLLLDSKRLGRNCWAERSLWPDKNKLIISTAWDAIQSRPPNERPASALREVSVQHSFKSLRQLVPFVREPKNGSEGSQGAYAYIETDGYAYAINGTSCARLPVPCTAPSLIPYLFLQQLKTKGQIDCWVGHRTKHWCYREHYAGAPSALSFTFVQRKPLSFPGAMFWGQELERHKAAQHLAPGRIPAFDSKVLHRARAFAESDVVEYTGLENPAYLWRSDGAGVCIMPLRAGPA